MRPLVGITLALALAAPIAQAQTKPSPDILEVCRARGGCQLTGVGLVVGLAGKGDNFDACPQSLAMLNSIMLRLGKSGFDPEAFNKNVAAVMVIAVVGRPSSNGAPLNDRKTDIYVASMGDASSLSGGTLLKAPLLRQDGQVYAIGHGKLSLCADKTSVEHACVVGGGSIF